MSIAEKRFETVKVAGCFYRYPLPLALASLYYKTGLDVSLGSLKPLLKHAGLHVVLLRKQCEAV